VVYLSPPPVTEECEKLGYSVDKLVELARLVERKEVLERELSALYCFTYAPPKNERKIMIQFLLHHVPALSGYGGMPALLSSFISSKIVLRAFILPSPVLYPSRMP
jgi:hypothetical protein